VHVGVDVVADVEDVLTVDAEVACTSCALPPR
jgi:hypothetical protein